MEDRRSEARRGFFNRVNTRYPSANVQDDLWSSDSIDERDEAWITQFAKSRSRTLAAQNGYGAARTDTRVKQAGFGRYLKRPGEARKSLVSPTHDAARQTDMSGPLDPVGLPLGETFAADEQIPANRFQKKPLYNQRSRSHAARTDPIDKHRESIVWGREYDPEYQAKRERIPGPAQIRSHEPYTGELGWWPPVEADVDKAADRRQRIALKDSYEQAKRDFIPHDLRHMLSPNNS